MAAACRDGAIERGHGMSHFTRIQDLKQQECIANPSARFLLSKIYSESSVNPVERSRVYGLDSKEEALREAINLIGDYDLSTTKFCQQNLSEAEEGNPAMNAAIADLAKCRRIALGDFTIEIDEL
jgi:hypothetical protein